MEDMKEFLNIIWMFILGLILINLNTSFGMYFSENYKAVFSVAITAAWQFIFIFVFSLINTFNKK